jgi:Uma2 family endonuclease
MDSHIVTFEPRLTDEEFEELCIAHNLNLEQTKEGRILMITAAGNDSSDANSEITTQLRIWWKTHRRGRVFDSDTRFVLPDGSKLGPDAAYITAERLAAVPRNLLRGFAPVCPNFVIELLSPTDSLGSAIQKMRDWIANGAELGWLIDPCQRTSYSFGQKAFTTGASELYGTGPVEGFVLDLTEVWSVFDAQ